MPRAATTSHCFSSGQPYPATSVRLFFLKRKTEMVKDHSSSINLTMEGIMLTKLLPPIPLLPQILLIVCYHNFVCLSCGAASLCKWFYSTSDCTPKNMQMESSIAEVLIKNGKKSGEERDWLPWIFLFSPFMMLNSIIMQKGIEFCTK